jgi:methionine-rich copper-binding protein CopC
MRIDKRLTFVFRLALWLALLLVGIRPSTAGAHASLVSSDPPNGAVRGPSLGRVVARFDLPLQSETSTLQVFDAAGSQVDVGDGRVDPGDTSRQSMTVRLPNPLPPGAYVVHWHALSDEGVHTGHVTDGEFSFWIAESAGALHPGWALAGLGVLGAVLSAFVIVRAQAGRVG